MEAEIFNEIPNELKTIEIDLEKKIFNVNGVPFGKGCSGFSISCDVLHGCKILMEIETTVKFAEYGINGQKRTDYTYEKHSQ